VQVCKKKNKKYGQNIGHTEKGDGGYICGSGISYNLKIAGAASIESFVKWYLKKSQLKKAEKPMHFQEGGGGEREGKNPPRLSRKTLVGLPWDGRGKPGPKVGGTSNSSKVGNPNREKNNHR